MKFNRFNDVVTLTIILALFVVMLGAYTRLTDAGLGCPDWPGCYGRMVLPTVKQALSRVQQQYPGMPIEARKAWTEMAHRYAAGTLGLLILLIGGISFLQKGALAIRKNALPYLLMGLLLFQALLGMWTVTLKLLPVVVMGHLLGGILIFCSLCYFRWQLSDVPGTDQPMLRFWVGLGMLVVFFQIALGGWVSSNYAGVACIGLPWCHGMSLSDMKFSEGFHLLAPVGANYQGGLLDIEARMSIQMVHRIGAVITALYVMGLSGWIYIRAQEKHLRQVALIAIMLVLLQFVLGVLNVIYLLPLWVAVAHNGVAAVLLAVMFSLFYLSKKEAAHVS